MKQLVRLFLAMGLVVITLTAMAQKPQIVFENLEHNLEVLRNLTVFKPPLLNLPIRAMFLWY
jgi:hypothetical protein